jgi:hypothetical protein
VTSPNAHKNLADEDFVLDVLDIATGATESGDIAGWIRILSNADQPISPALRALLIKFLGRCRYNHKSGRRPQSPHKRLVRNIHLHMAAADAERLEQLWRLCNRSAGEEYERRFKQRVDEWEIREPGIIDEDLLWQGLQFLRDIQSELGKLRTVEVREYACEFLSKHYNQEANSYVTGGPPHIKKKTLLNLVNRGASARQRIIPRVTE